MDRKAFMRYLGAMAGSSASMPVLTRWFPGAHGGHPTAPSTPDMLASAGRAGPQPHTHPADGNATTVEGPSVRSAAGGVGEGTSVSRSTTTLPRDDHVSGVRLSIGPSPWPVIAASDAPQAWKDVAYAICDGIDDHLEIQTAINNLSPDTNSAGVVYLSPGTFIIGATLWLPEAFRLIGAGSGPGMRGSTLMARDGLNADIIQCDGLPPARWWHWGEIAHINIDGNKAHNTSGTGINLERMGETATVHHVYVARCASHGVRIGHNTAPATLDQVSVFHNGGAGLYLDTIAGDVNLIQLSGDGNLGGIIHATGAYGALGSVNVLGLKAEIPDLEMQGHDPLIVLDHYFGSFNLFGGTALNAQDSAEAPKTLIRITNGGYFWSRVSIIGFATTYSLIIDDQSINASSLAYEPGGGTRVVNHFNSFVGFRKLGDDMSTYQQVDGFGRVRMQQAADVIPHLGDGAGPGATVAVKATDVGGRIELTTGTSASGAREIAQVAFGTPWPIAPRAVLLTPGNAAAAELAGPQMTYISSIRSESFSIMAGNMALEPETSYVWFYQVVG